MTLRCTQKLLSRLRLGSSGEPPPPTALLGDWVATRLVMRAAHLVGCVSERSYLAVVREARRLDTLAERFERMLADGCLGRGCQAAYEDQGAHSGVRGSRSARSPGGARTPCDGDASGQRAEPGTAQRSARIRRRRGIRGHASALARMVPL